MVYYMRMDNSMTNINFFSLFYNKIFNSLDFLIYLVSFQ